MRRALISFSTRPIRSIGGRGDPKRWPRRSRPTGRSCCRSATRPATGAMSWRTKALRTTPPRDVMNELFVNIKVDREERPDIDQIYMAALHHLGEHGGWPLTMFLTPDGEPIWGGTYFPNSSRYGKPAFVDVLREIARLFRDEPQKIEQNRAALMERLTAAAHPAGAATFGRSRTRQCRPPARRHHRPGQRWHPRRAEISANSIIRTAMARRAAHRRSALLRGRRHHAAPHLRGRHLRSSRRRLLPLFGRRALAGAAFRKNALRQCAAARALGDRVSARRQRALSPARRRNRRLARSAK